MDKAYRKFCVAILKEFGNCFDFKSEFLGSLVEIL